MPQITETILVVDDEPSDLESVRKSLERIGYRVITAAEGHGALRLYQRYGRPVSLLIADVAMAPMNGCDLALQLSAIQPDLKVLFISGYTGEGVLRREGMAGLNATFLRKPFTSQELTESVQALMEARQE